MIVELAQSQTELIQKDDRKKSDDSSQNLLSDTRHARNLTAQIEQDAIGKDLDVPECGASFADVERILENSALNVTQWYVRKETEAEKAEM